MTATLTPTPAGTAGPRAAASIAAALAGRLGWRLWWPLVPWLAHAAISRLALANEQTSGEYGAWTTAPAGTLLIGSLLAVIVLWFWGARFALTLGHRRGPVFAASVIGSLALLAGLHLLSCLANTAEFHAVGYRGIRVFAHEPPNEKFASPEHVFNGSWQLLALYGVPVLCLLVLICCWGLRWRVLGTLGGILVGVAGFALVSPLWLALDRFQPATQSNWGSGMVAMAVYEVALLALAWVGFRRAPA